jgi:hypothetical protein
MQAFVFNEPGFLGAMNLVKNSSGDIVLGTVSTCQFAVTFQPSLIDG